LPTLSFCSERTAGMTSGDRELILQLKRSLLPVLSSLGVELVDLEYRRERRGWVLRLYIDREGGVSLQDCQRVSEHVGDILDVEDLIDHPYSLEVSSPGLDRPLVKETDFERFAGRTVKISTREPVGNRSNFRGRLMGVDNHQVRIQLEEGEVLHLPAESIAKARLVPEFPEEGRMKGSCRKI